MLKSLLKEIQLFTILSTVAIICTVIFISSAIISYAKLIDLRQSSVLTANEIESFLRYPLYAVDDDQAVRIAETFLLSKRISGIVLKSSANGVILSKTDADESHWIPRITREIHRDEILLGKFTITFSDEEIFRNILQLSIVSLIIIIAVFMVVKFAYRFLIISRVNQTFSPILSAFANFSEGNYETSIKPTRYKDVNNIVSHFNDMAEKIRQKNSEQKKIEKTLINERRYLMDIIDFLPDATFIVDTEKKVVAWNRATEAMTGVPRHEILGKGEYEYALPFFRERRPILIDYLDVPYNDSERIYKYIKQTDTAIYAESFAPHLNKGRGAHLWGVAAPLFDQNGNRTGAIELIRDVTDYKKAEKDRHQLQSQLQQAQKLEAIGTLAGGIAHDFNNILSAIVGYSELALAELRLEAPIKSKLEAIHSSGLRARDLVSQILTFSRKDDHDKSPIELHLIVDEALRLLRPAIPSTIDIKTQIASTCRIIGDPSRIHQIIMNLCTNAYQAMHETGGVLKILLSHEELKGETAVHAGVPPGYYGKLIVSDTGIGIPSKDIDRIFEPYFTTKEKGKGTGLGLAVAHGIAKSHGGTILVNSQIGQGTSFKVYLPLTHEREYKGEKEISPLLGGKECILFVDDEPDILKIGKEMLEKLGYCAKVTGNAQETLKLFAKQPDQFDLVITDMTMPDMTGDKLVGELRKTRADIPIVLCTGYSDLISKEEAKSKGINGFLMKPFLLSDIDQMIRKVLDEAERSSSA